MAIVLPTGQIIATEVINGREYLLSVLSDSNGTADALFSLSGQPQVVEAVDPLGANNLSIMRRLFEQILIELQTLNANFANSYGLMNTITNSDQTVQTIQQ